MAGICRPSPSISWRTGRTAGRPSTTPICGPGTPCPPHRPQVLATYLGRITRQLSIDRWRARGRVKRGGSQYALSLEELGDCVSGAATPEEALDLAELGRAIGDYLRTLPLPARRAFLCRYYYADSLAETARVCGISVPAVKSQLYRTRQGLRTYLKKEGFDI